MVNILRHRTRQVRVGRALIGGDAPILVQSMTNTDTADAQSTTAQVAELAGAGSEIVRVTVNTAEAAAQVPRIRERLDAMGCDVPLVGDFHFNGHKLLAEPLDSDAVTREALVASALESAARAEELGLPGDRIVLSCKVSGVQDLIAVYRELARRCDYPLHLGLTEAGMGTKGIVASTAALGVLLQEGIGDTIRISLTPEPGGDRAREVVVAQELLQTMGLRSFSPMVIACPGCGRTTSTYFQELAEKIQRYLREQMPQWRE